MNDRTHSHARPARTERTRRIGGHGRFGSPWSFRTRCGMLLWHVTWTLLCRPTPKILYRWRNVVLGLFGCRIQGRPFVASSARIRIPWNVLLEDRSCIGEKAVLYSLGRITLGARCTVAQEAYLCAGTHDFSDPDLPLMVGDIDIGGEAFIGARAFVLPGVRIGEGALVGAGSVVASDVDAWTVVAGNPCVPLRERQYRGRRPKPGSTT